MITGVEALAGTGRGNPTSIREVDYRTEEKGVESPLSGYDDEGCLIIMPEGDENNNGHHQRYHRRRASSADDDDSTDSNLLAAAAVTGVNWSSPAPLSSGSDIDATSMDLSNHHHHHHHLKRKDVFNARKQREFIPDNKKDESYWDRRRRNNEAAKRSREKRRLNDMVLESRVFELTKENTYLRSQLMAIRDKYGIVGENLVGNDVNVETAAANDNQVALNLTKRAKLLSPLLNSTTMAMLAPGSPPGVALRSLVMASSALHHHQNQPNTPTDEDRSNINRLRQQQHRDYWPVKSEEDKPALSCGSGYIARDDEDQQHRRQRHHHHQHDAHYHHHHNNNHHHQAPVSQPVRNQDTLLGALNGTSLIYGAPRHSTDLEQSSPMSLSDYQHHNGLPRMTQLRNGNGVVTIVAANPRELECRSNESSASGDDRTTVESKHGRRYSGVEAVESAPSSSSYHPTTSDSLQQLHLPHKLRHKPRLSECSMQSGSPPAGHHQPHLLLMASTMSSTSPSPVREEDDENNVKHDNYDEDAMDVSSRRHRKYSVFRETGTAENKPLVTEASHLRTPSPASKLEVENSQLKLEMKRLAVEMANLKDMMLASSNKSDTSSRDSGFATDGEPERDTETTPT